MRKIVLILLVFEFCLSQPVFADEWSQDAHDAQRTGATAEDPGPAAGWNFAWFWASPANNNPPREGRAVTGGGNIYLPAGGSGLFALNIANGSQSWRFTTSSFNASPAYSNGFVYAGDADGKLHKINASTGQSEGSAYNAGSPINKAVLLVGNYVYAVSDNGILHKVNTVNMSGVWQYQAGANASTLAAYSKRNLIIYATADLYIHAVNESDGSRRWRVKPSPNSPGSSSSGGWSSFNWGWPVVADNHGVVFLRMQLPHQAHFDGPNNGLFANTNAENRAWLENNPQNKNLFALDLETGGEKFVPAVGYGSTEGYINGQTVGVMGSQPVVRTWPNGDEVAYIPFRNGQGCNYDYRWHGHMGEMVLDSTTVPGLSAGDLRFVKMNRDCGQGGSTYVHIIDEEAPVTMAANDLFYAHWGASGGVQLNRSANLGLTYDSPIVTTNLPTVIRAQSGCGDTTTHKANCGLSLYNDGRYWDGPGWFVYLNQTDPPGSPVSGSYSGGFLPRYTFVSGGFIIVEGNGGDLFVLEHSGSPLPTSSPTSSPSPQIPFKQLLSDWLTQENDLNGDGKVNSLDFARLILLQ